jgi:hypothetical protein
MGLATISFAIRAAGGEAMDDVIRPDEQPAAEGQLDLFGAEPVPSYQPDPDKVRARLHKILAEARSSKIIPWEPSRTSLYRTIFPQMTQWLPEDEGIQLRALSSKPSWLDLKRPDQGRLPIESTRCGCSADAER